MNSDLHYDNILAARREPWLAIDPKVVAGDVEYGLAPLVWNLYRRIDPTALAAHFQTLIAISECDTERARQWTIVRIVDYWLWAVETGLTSDPKMCRSILECLL